ncbi:hypothetical protein CCR75_006040 [Bremia lactucae]|uniref:Polyprotein n=1 Tax=Bremia lactucae TaxID=4779 RepID=A0A976FMK7_BRELC|nr:hypothetical protein CCR75_006040 [Bremia lactucae]
MALVLETHELLWLRILVLMHNKSAIAMASNQGYISRARHIDLRAHFVRGHIEAGGIKVKYIPTNNQSTVYY